MSGAVKAAVQNCGNCKWGRFLLSKHKVPRPLDHSGDCAYPLSSLVFPKSIGWQDIYKHRVWPEFIDCPTWTPKDEV